MPETRSREELFEIAHDSVKASDALLIVSPQPPDVDSVASCSLLSGYASLIKKPYTLFSAGNIPTREENSLFGFLPLQFTRTLPPSVPSCVLAVDYGSFRTCGLGEGMWWDPNSFVIGFDHHDEPADDFPIGGLQIVDTDAPSTTALLYRFFRYIGIDISKSMATSVALGIYTDTARLTNHKANFEAFRILTACLEKGIPWEEIRNAAKPKMPLERLRVWERAFREIEFDSRLGLTSLMVDLEKLLSSWKGKPQDILTILGIMQSIEHTRVAVLFLEERAHVWRAIFRSNVPEKISVAPLARMIGERMGGGGHPHAAAALFSDHADFSPITALEKIKLEIGKMLYKT